MRSARSSLQRGKPTSKRAANSLFTLMTGSASSSASPSNRERVGGFLPPMLASSLQYSSGNNSAHKHAGAVVPGSPLPRRRRFAFRYYVYRRAVPVDPAALEPSSSFASSSCAAVPKRFATPQLCNGAFVLLHIVYTAPPKHHRTIMAAAAGPVGPMLVRVKRKRADNAPDDLCKLHILPVAPRYPCRTAVVRRPSPACCRGGGHARAPRRRRCSGPRPCWAGPGPGRRTAGRGGAAAAPHQVPARVDSQRGAGLTPGRRAAR